MVIELQRGQLNKWTIYRSVAAVVDSIYLDKPYTVERRFRMSGGGCNCDEIYAWRVTSEELEKEGDPAVEGV